MPAAVSPAHQRAVHAFRELFHAEPRVVARAPGRVNLIGEHVDYNGGFVLPVAIDRDVVVAAAPRSDGIVRVRAVDAGEEVILQVHGDSAPLVGWRSYIAGVIALLSQIPIPIEGADLSVAGDVPIGAGLSSSAAFEVAVATAFLGLADRTLPGPELAVLCRRAEVEYARVQCGIMDQFVSVLGKAGHALLLDCRSLESRYIPLPGSVRLVITDSGVRRDLQSSAFNERFSECRTAAEQLGVRELREISPAEFERRASTVTQPAARRARHVVYEIARTLEAAGALERGDLSRVGSLMYESHAGLRDEYEVSLPELDLLVESARRIDGVYGSRVSGAGFGGCTLSLVAEEAVPEFERAVPGEYLAATGRHAEVLVARSSGGASLQRGT